jgi:predicted nucleic acid-binding protein
MPWIVDTDVFIEGERGNVAFAGWLQSADGIATADVVRGEFLIGVHAVADEAIRRRGVQFYADRIAALPCYSSEPSDYAKAAALAGDARRSGKGKPGLIDGLIAAIAIRKRAKVATQNTKDFEAMGVPLCKSVLGRSMASIPAGQRTVLPDFTLPCHWVRNLFKRAQFSQLPQRGQCVFLGRALVRVSCLLDGGCYF